MSSLADRFHSKYKKSSDGCWLWTAYRDAIGYGRMAHEAENKAHRISWVLHNGPIPHGMKVLHRCDVRACVNPAHLFLGTQADNVRDMMEKGRHGIGGVPGEANPQAKLTAQQVKEIRERYAATKVSQYKLADEYGVGVMTINRAIRKLCWGHV